MIEIWEPRWKDRKVLVSVNKVKHGKNLLRFTKCPTLPDVYSFDGDAVMEECNVTKIGKSYKINCYEIPMYMLRNETKENGRVRDKSNETTQMVLEEMRY